MARLVLKSSPLRLLVNFKTNSVQTLRRHTQTQSAVCSDILLELREIEAAGTYKRERIITGKSRGGGNRPQSAFVQVESMKDEVLNFCANNYLGLASNAEVMNAAKQAIFSHGAGLSSVRFICGTTNLHRKLERTIAKFHGRDDAILYPSCFDANAGIFEVLMGKDDAIITDELNHASIIDGIRLSKAQRFIYKHLDMTSLEEKLFEAKGARRRMVVTDGVFSMDGDVAPLPRIVELADKYDAVVFADECHATGFFGKTGRGTEEYFEMNGEVDIINSTLGKALGGAMGGYTTGPQPIVDLLRQRSRPYLFSNALAPAAVGAAEQALNMVMESPNLPARLTELTHLFRDRMRVAGFNVIGNRDHPICPVMLGDARLATEFADAMLKDYRIYVIGFSFPVVPKGKARIRVQISAAHTENQIQKLVVAFTEVGMKLKVIS